MHAKVKKISSFLLCFLLMFQQVGFAQVAAELNIAGHLSSLHSPFISSALRPLHLRYLQFNPLDNSFKLLLDKGSFKNPSSQEIEDASKTLMQYFLIGITLPNDTFWVNLRPDSPDQIIDDRLAQTDIGKIMLETDLQLKKDTASFTSPQTPEGRQYWDKLYKKAEELYGTDSVTIPTLTRPWIVPGEIIIRETTDSAYIYKATLKVCLEQDYLKNTPNAITSGVDYTFKDSRSKALNEYSTQLIKELIIPKLTREVNSSKRYAPLRQVYYSLIMAQWFKARFKGKQGAYYDRIDSQNLANLTSRQDWSKTTYFDSYRKSFAEGEYNIQEPVYTPTGQVIRSYMSGGEMLGLKAEEIPSFGGPGKVVSSPAIRNPVVNNKLVEINIASSSLEGGSAGPAGGNKYEESPEINLPREKVKPPLKKNFSLTDTILSWTALAALTLIIPSHTPIGIKLESFILDPDFVNQANLVKDIDMSELNNPIQKLLSELSREKLRQQLITQYPGTKNPVYEYSLYRNLRKEELKDFLPHYPIQIPSFVQGFHQPTQIMQIKVMDDKPYLVAKHDILPIFFFIFDNNGTQGLAFDRIGFFTETKYGLLTTEDALRAAMRKDNYTGAEGHDYRLKDIVNFFNQAEKQGVSLNPMEERIKNELLRSGLIIKIDGKEAGQTAEGNGSYKETVNGAVLSCCKNPTRAAVEHEFNHGVYFTDNKYYQAANSLWAVVQKENPQAAEFVLRLFESRGYDINNKDLVAREFTAFFRDKDELLLYFDYNWGRKVIIADKNDVLSRCKPYFDAEGVINDKARQIIDYLNKAALSIETGVNKVASSLTSDRNSANSEIKNMPLSVGKDKGDGSNLSDAPLAAGSPVRAKLPAEGSSPLGGIDFRSLPIVTRAVNNLGANFRDNLPRLQFLQRLNLGEEWQAIERMANSGIKPSAERIMEYAQASSALGKINQDKDKIILCISDILRNEEEECYETNPVLLDILMVLESIQQPQQLKEVFLGVTT